MDTPVRALQVTTKKLPARRHFLVAFFISLTWGIFGVDRFYMGKWLTGLLKLVTIGGYGLWVVIDLMSIMNGSMRDAWGRSLHGAVEYRPFVNKFALILSLFGLLFAIIIAALVWIAFSYIWGQVSGGSLEGSMDGLFNSKLLNVDGLIDTL